MTEMNADDRDFFKEQFTRIKEDSGDRLIVALMEAGVLVAVLGPLESIMGWFLESPTPSTSHVRNFASGSLLFGLVLIALGYGLSVWKESRVAE